MEVNIPGKLRKETVARMDNLEGSVVVGVLRLSMQVCVSDSMPSTRMILTKAPNHLHAYS